MKKLNLKGRNLLVLILGCLVFFTITTPHAVNAYGSESGRILYTSNPEGMLSGEVFIMDSDGTNQVNLTNSVQNESYASWSPDGKRILFTRGEEVNSNQDLFIMDPDGSDVVNLTNTSDRSEMNPVWSPDGDYIRFISTSSQQSGRYANFTIRADGSDITEMPILINPDGSTVEGWAFAFQPWSPDSSRIIVPETFSGGMRLYSIKPDGTDQVQLSGFLDGYNWAYGPSWSPDSSKIFYEEFGEGTMTAHKVVNASDGSVVSEQTVTRESAVAVSTWSSDGNNIFYSAKEEGDSYSVNLYRVGYTNGNFGSPAKLTDFQCQQEECGVFQIDIAENRVLFSQILPQQNFAGAVTDVFAVDNYSSLLNLTNHAAPEGTAKLSLITYNAMEPVTSDEPVVTITPNPPKTGKLIGATIASVSIISIILLLAKETKDRHHNWGSVR